MKTITVKIQEGNRKVSGKVRLYESGKLIGFANYLIKGEYLKLLEINIEKEFRLKGYGRFLVDVICAIAKKLKRNKIQLLSLKDSLPFWRQVGFEVMQNECGMYYMERELE